MVANTKLETPSTDALKLRPFLPEYEPSFDKTTYGTLKALISEVSEDKVRAAAICLGVSVADLLHPASASPIVSPSKVLSSDPRVFVNPNVADLSERAHSTRHASLLSTLRSTACSMTSSDVTRWLTVGSRMITDSGVIPETDWEVKQQKRAASKEARFAEEQVKKQQGFFQSLVRAKKASDAREAAAVASREQYEFFKKSQKEVFEKKAQQLRERLAKIKASAISAAEENSKKRRETWEKIQHKITETNQRRAANFAALLEPIEQKKKSLALKYQTANDLLIAKNKSLSDALLKKSEDLAKREKTRKDQLAVKREAQEREITIKIHSASAFLEAKQKQKETAFLNELERIEKCRISAESIREERAKIVRISRETSQARAVGNLQNLTMKKNEIHSYALQKYQTQTEHARIAKSLGLKCAVPLVVHSEMQALWTSAAQENKKRLDLARKARTAASHLSLELTERKVNLVHQGHLHFEKLKDDTIREQNLRNTKIRAAFEDIKAETDNEKIRKHLVNAGLSHDIIKPLIDGNSNI